MHHRGFTLLELLVVVAILASLAVGMVVATEGSDAQAKQELARRDLILLRQALLDFERDLGHFPGQGRLALDNKPGGQTPTPDPGTYPLYPAWYEHPANLVALQTRTITNPFVPPGHPDREVLKFDTYDPSVRRGWRGPYLQSIQFRFVTLKSLQTIGTAQELGLFDLERANTTQLPPMPALSDTLLLPPHSERFAWQDPLVEDAPGGSPYLVIHDTDPLKSRVVFVGPNRKLDDPEASTSDDLSIPLRTLQ